jgi:hypothetical protein
MMENQAFAPQRPAKRQSAAIGSKIDLGEHFLRRTIGWS